MDGERARDRDEPRRTDPEEAAETDELGLYLALELIELGDRSRLDELAQARGDARADAAQLLNAAGTHELGDRRLRLANRLCGTTVRTRGVVARAGQIE
jgi:hypothetical protein